MDITRRRLGTGGCWWLVVGLVLGWAGCQENGGDGTIAGENADDGGTEDTDVADGPGDSEEDTPDDPGGEGGEDPSTPDTDSDTDDEEPEDTDGGLNPDAGPTNELQVAIGSPSDGETLKEGDIVRVAGKATGGKEPYEYLWTFDDVAEDAIELEPGEIRLPRPGAFEFVFSVTDGAGDTASASVTVAVDELIGDMGLWFGNLHSHTGYSDGEGTPAEAFAWARDIAKLDFYAVTDHAESLTKAEWKNTAEQAELAGEDDVFVAVVGFEWSHPINGHVCIFATDEFNPAYLSPWISFIYDWIDTNDGLAQFNHPGREIGVFDNFSYVPKAADNFFAIETGNKGDGNAPGEFLPYYNKALDRGWRLAPTNNQDNHSLKINSHRTVYVGEMLSRDALTVAILERRLYSTDDPNMEIVFKQGDRWMGSEIAPTGDTVRFSVKVTDDEPITELNLVTDRGKTAAEYVPVSGATTVLWTPEVPVGSSSYFFLKVVGSDELDGEEPEQVAVTAPFFIR